MSTSNTFSKKAIIGAAALLLVGLGGGLWFASSRALPVSEKSPNTASSSPSTVVSPAISQHPASRPEPRAPKLHIIQSSDMASAAVASVRTAGAAAATELKASPDGIFPQTKMPPSASAEVVLTFPDGEPGDAITLQCEDGGHLDEDLAVKNTTLDAARSVSFTMHTAKDYGVYQVTLRRGVRSESISFLAGN